MGLRAVAAPKGNTFAKGNKGGGRPEAYEPRFVTIARAMALQGATDEEIAVALDVSVRTLYLWKARHEEFSAALKAQKDIADDRVERSLYNRAVGYTYDAVKIFLPRGAVEPVIVPYKEHVPPDPGAAFNWLRNRRKDTWRDSKELTGADGAPLVPPEEMTPEALNARRASALMALLAKVQAEAAQAEPEAQGAPPPVVKRAKSAKRRKAKRKTS